MSNKLVVAEDNVCKCVGKHVPLPHLLHEMSNGEYVCPTTYCNVLSLLSEYKREGGRPPGSVRKHYSDYVQRLAREAYTGVQ